MEEKNLSEFLPKVTFEEIPIKELVADQGYQRNLSEKHVRKAASNFDIYQINPVKVSRRDGKNYVFNGQHTVEIVADVSGSRDTPVWCMVYEEAKKFYDEHGHFKVPQKYMTESGIKLYNWIAQQRRIRRGTIKHSVELSDDKIAKLDALGMNLGK